MRKLKNTAGTIAKGFGMIASGFLAILPLTACTDIMVPNIGGSGGNDMFDTMQKDLKEKSHTTKTADKENFYEISSIDGAEKIVSCIKIEDTESTKTLDLNEFREILARNEVNWLQMNFGGSTATLSNIKHICYLYMPENTSYTEMLELTELCRAAGYEANTITAEDYETYRSTGEDFYYPENTYYGPASAGQ